ncbi:MAG: LamG domain-containing protein, partial [Clostridia bacterium]|nr:LamG domain-containing protein [Clostridia bacterium]
VTTGEIEDMEIRDTASVILHALGYEQPDTWTGRVPSGLFEGVNAVERPVWVDTESPRYHETQPTPEYKSDNYITSVLKDVELNAYFTFDGTTEDDFGNSVAENGKLYFIENGYFDGAVSLDDGYISLENYKLGKESFSIGFWINTKGSASDPPILSNKDWQSGYNSGFALILKDGTNIVVNVGNGSSRLDFNYPLPSDYRTGWMHVLLIADRGAGTISLCYDFGKLITMTIPASLKNATFDALSNLNIGQDGTGSYGPKLAADLDELMIFGQALTQDEITALAFYYGKERDASATEDDSFRDHESVDTPTADQDGYITNYITDTKLNTYLTFDGSAEDALGNVAVEQKGSVTYADGFFGQGAVLNNGYVSIKDYAPGTDSFTIALWIKTTGVSSDPAIFSNKDWNRGTNNGFILSLRNSSDIKFNMGNGSARMDKEIALPYDYQAGWMHLTLVMDRTAGQVRISIDFGEFVTVAMPDAIKNVSADAFGVLNIGQDGTGNYPAKLTATVDEFMVFDGALTQKDVTSLADYYGVKPAE